MNTGVGAVNDVAITPLVVSVEQASQLTLLGRTYLYTLINDGTLSSIKRGKRRLILYQSLKQYLSDESKQESTQDGWR